MESTSGSTGLEVRWFVALLATMTGIQKGLDCF